MGNVLIYVKFTIWLFRYTAVVFFIISYNSKNWFEYISSSRYINYGLWHYCDRGTCVTLRKYAMGISNKAYIVDII